MDKQPEGHPLEWLIIFLVYNNNYYDKDHKNTKDYYTMEEQTKYILNQIRYTNFNEEVKTLFVEAEIKNRKNGPYATISILEKKKDSWLSAFEKMWREKEVADFFTNRQSIQKILEKIKGKYSANRNMIITVGHGSIVGINYFIPELNQAASRSNQKELEPILKEKQIEALAEDNNRGPFAEITTEKGKHLLFLSTQEIAEAVGTVFGKKVDILVMYNCIMQNVFTQYDLKETVDWFIAPLSGISIPGYNYGEILNKISLNPHMDNADIAKNFIDSIRMGNRYHSFRNDIEGSWKFSAEKLDSVVLNEMQERFNTVFEIIDRLSVDTVVIYQVNEVIKHLFSYSHYCLPAIQIFDLGSFLSSLSDKIKTDETYTELANAIIELQATLQSNSRKKFTFTGNDFYVGEREISYYDTMPSNSGKISDMALVFPINKPNFDLLNLIYEESEYEQRGLPDNKYHIPPFLISAAYARVVNKIQALIPM